MHCEQKQDVKFPFDSSKDLLENSYFQICLLRNVFHQPHGNGTAISDLGQSGLGFTLLEIEEMLKEAANRLLKENKKGDSVDSVLECYYRVAFLHDLFSQPHDKGTSLTPEGQNGLSYALRSIQDNLERIFNEELMARAGQP